jgi:hypothetical protein
MLHRRRRGPGDLHDTLRGLGVGPIGALLMVAFSLVLMFAAITIPAYQGAERMAEIRFYAAVLLVLGSAAAAHVWMSLQRARKARAPEERLPERGDTADCVALRLALDAASAEPLIRALDEAGAAAPSARLRLAAQALVAARPGWALASVDSFPRMESARLGALADRLVADFAKRYPSRSDRGGRMLRGEPRVVVVGVLVISPLTLDHPPGDPDVAIEAILRNLAAIADDTSRVELHVSGALPRAEVSERDAAMAPLRA